MENSCESRNTGCSNNNCKFCIGYFFSHGLCSTCLDISFVVGDILDR
jgi:hypothetical protein